MVGGLGKCIPVGRCRKGLLEVHVLFGLFLSLFVLHPDCTFPPSSRPIPYRYLHFTPILSSSFLFRKGLDVYQLTIAYQVAVRLDKSLTWTPRDSQRLNQQLERLHRADLRPLYLCYGCVLVLLLEPLTVRAGSASDSVFCLRNPFLLLGCLVQFSFKH